jgi:magnesium-transporting ATPase (P-type)
VLFATSEVEFLSQVWVLTGDKMETAVNIGKSCSLLDDTLQLQVLKGTSAAAVKQCLQTILLNLDHLGKQVAKSSDSNPSTISAAALVADGPALQFALAKASLRALLLQLIQHPMCRVCICSRMAPRQKAAVVELVKLKLGAITLAIGDGVRLFIQIHLN